MEHKAYLDTVKQLAAAKWGKQYEDDKAAQRALIKEIDLSGACLLGIIQRIDAVLDALTETAISKRCSDIRVRANATISTWIAEQEKLHGECPYSVRRWAERCVHESLGFELIHYDGLPSRDYTYALREWRPAKDTPLRKEFDKWKRKKIKPAAQE